MRIIKLMADYGSFPLWEASPGIVGNINPEDLPISSNLKSSIAAWALEYDSTLDYDDPARSGFPSQMDEDNFIKKGIIISNQLRVELGSNFLVVTQF